jgi:hypothetical protein
MQRRTKTQQLSTLQACYSTNKKVKKMQVTLDSNSSLPTKANQTANNNTKSKIKQLHREVAAKVNGVSGATFAVLTERRLFEETRKFSTEAEALPACSSIEKTTDAQSKILPKHIFQARASLCWRQQLRLYNITQLSLFQSSMMHRDWLLC